ncbi:MAG: 30S ribosomal protein S9 [Candidatus Dojkabacteria bacterium]|nr:MAG: 30S ribosomal protein S9 [Candidatus Dojkabacteria bacterium]
MAEKYFEGVGRRKTSTARVRIYKGKDTSIVNEKPLDGYFPTKADVSIVLEPLKTVGLEGEYYFTAKVSGGGMTGQREAVQLGLARALYSMDSELKPKLRSKGLVTRDPRMVERKKYNLRKARKKAQFSKR